MTQNTTVLVCTAISLFTTGLGYLWGKLRTRSEWRERSEKLLAIAQMYEKQKDMLLEKYEALQKEIECTVHETHEEVEKPFVENMYEKYKLSNGDVDWSAISKTLLTFQGNDIALKGGLVEGQLYNQVHEVHEETERPHVEKGYTDWLQLQADALERQDGGARRLSGEPVQPAEQLLYVSKDSKEAEKDFLDSVYGKEPDRREPGEGC